jgi:hypothetical protein
MASVSQIKPAPENPTVRKAEEGWVHVRMDIDVRRRLKIRSAELEITMADAVRCAVREWLEKAA